MGRHVRSFLSSSAVADDTAVPWPRKGEYALCLTDHCALQSHDFTIHTWDSPREIIVDQCAPETMRLYFRTTVQSTLTAKNNNVEIATKANSSNIGLSC